MSAVSPKKSASSSNGGAAKKKTKTASAKAARNTNEWHVTCSAMSARIVNPIRAISDKAGSLAAGGCDKPLIKLSVGDPTLDKNFFNAPQRHVDAVKAALDSHDFNGYVPASGTPEARQAVSDFWTKNFITPAAEAGENDDAQAAYNRKVASIPKEHVVLTSGGSHAIQLAITSICGPGDSVLLPTPCFPHYITICDTYKIKKKFYKLDPKKHWEVNLKQVEAQCDATTKLLVITNPSNPCGSNYSHKHVEAIVKLAEKLKLPLFSDEIYAGMVFQNEKKHKAKPGDKQRHSFTSVVDFNTSVPRVVLGGTAKQFAVPGWRLGWLIYASDSSIDKETKKGDRTAPKIEKGQKYPSNSGDNLLYGIEQQALLIVGPTALAQGALPSFLSGYSTSMAPRAAKSAEEMEKESQEEKDEAFFYRYVSQIEQCARTFVTALNEKCRVPTAAAGDGSSSTSTTSNAEDGEAAKQKKTDKKSPTGKKEKPHHMVYAQMPQGAMYVMMKVNSDYFDQAIVHDEYSFFENILKEQHVQLVPGNTFRRPGYLRVVITRPEPVLLEAVDRIAAFCAAHYDAEGAAKRLAEKAEKKKAKKKTTATDEDKKKKKKKAAHSAKESKQKAKEQQQQQPQAEAPAAITEEASIPAPVDNAEVPVEIVPVEEKPADVQGASAEVEAVPAAAAEAELETEAEPAAAAEGEKTAETEAAPATEEVEKKE